MCVKEIASKILLIGLAFLLADQCLAQIEKIKLQPKTVQTPKEEATEEENSRLAEEMAQEAAYYAPLRYYLQ